MKIDDGVITSGDFMVIVLDSVKLVDFVPLGRVVTFIEVVPGKFEYVVGACDLELVCIVSDDLAVVGLLPGNLLVDVIPCSFVVVAGDSDVVIVISGILVVVLPPNDFVVDKGGCSFVNDFPNDSGLDLEIVAGDWEVVAVVTDKLTVADVLDVMFVGGGGCVVFIAVVPTAMAAVVVSRDAVETVPARYVYQKG